MRAQARLLTQTGCSSENLSAAGGRLRRGCRSNRANRRADAQTVRPAEFFQVNPSVERKHLGVADAAIPVFLQPHALAARHFRQLRERKHQKLAVFADHRHMVAIGGNDERGGRRLFDVKQRLPLRVPPTISSCGATKPRPSLAATSIFAPGA